MIMNDEMMTFKTAAVAYLFDWMNYRRNNSARMRDAHRSKIEISQIQCEFFHVTFLSLTSNRVKIICTLMCGIQNPSCDEDDLLLPSADHHDIHCYSMIRITWTACPVAALV
jgi:hypothetical protein